MSGGAQVVTLQELAQTQADMPRLALLLTTRLSRKALVRFPVGEPGNVVQEWEGGEKEEKESQ